MYTIIVPEDFGLVESEKYQNTSNDNKYNVVEHIFTT